MGRMRNGAQPSGREDWEMPPELMEVLEAEFGTFDLDPCCTFETKKARDWIDIKEGSDGLAEPWFEKTFVNPPYGRGIWRWVEKCYQEVECGHAEIVVALLPLSGASWWHKWVMQATEIRLLKQRIKFVGAAWIAPFDSVIVIWRRGMLGCRWLRSWDIKAGGLL